LSTAFGYAFNPKWSGKVKDNDCKNGSEGWWNFKLWAVVILPPKSALMLVDTSSLSVFAHWYVRYYFNDHIAEGG
jgi:hypothetical protein